MKVLRGMISQHLKHIYGIPYFSTHGQCTWFLCILWLLPLWIWRHVVPVEGTVQILHEGTFIRIEWSVDVIKSNVAFVGWCSSWNVSLSGNPLTKNPLYYGWYLRTTLGRNWCLVHIKISFPGSLGYGTLCTGVTTRKHTYGWSIWETLSS